MKHDADGRPKTIRRRADVVDGIIEAINMISSASVSVRCGGRWLTLQMKAFAARYPAAPR